MNPRDLLSSGGIGIVYFYALLCGVVFLLQWFPFTGIFLMILGGPIWIGALVHVMMAHLTIGALSRRLEFAWLALPIAYYAGGGAMHLKSVQEAQALAAQIETANAEQSLPVAQPFSYFSENFETLNLLEMYRAASAFTKGNGANGKQEYIEYYYAKNEECDTASRGYYSNERFTNPFAFRPHLFYYVNDPSKTRQCLLQKSVYEASPIYEIKSWLDRDLRTTVLLRPYVIAWQARDTRTNANITVRVGSITTLPLAQTIVAGCGLNSSKPAWECGSSLLYSSQTISVGVKKRADGGNPFIPTRDPDTWEVTALGRALGLTPREPSD